MDIKTLRQMRQASQQNFGKIAQEFEKIANPSQGYKDDRFWKPEQDKAGNASATIRFLGSPDPAKLPWVKVFSHAFQGPTGKWYIENSLSTIGETDFVGEENSRLYNSGNADDKKLAQSRKRKLNYIANILVVSDPKHPENEGKVFLFKFGKKIFDKIMDKAQPSFAEDTPVNVFDYWTGADFKLRMKKVDGFPNYDASTFAEPSEVADEEELMRIIKSQHDLAEFLDRKNFKSYDELKAKYMSVVHPTGAPAKKANDVESDELPSREAPVAASKAPAPQRSKPAAQDDESDLGLDYFRSLAEDE